MPEVDKDAIFKLRFKRYLWNMGYFCPIEVKLSAYAIKYGSHIRYDITDIDVAGIRFDNDLSHAVVIGDCKTGVESSVNRIFWLKGVMDFFGANRGYFVKPKINDNAKQVASKLNISLLSEENLTLIEKEANLESLRFSIFDVDTYNKVRSLWGINLGKDQKPNESQLKLKEIYHYLEYIFWVTDDYRNINSIIEKLTEIKRYYLGYSQEKIKFLIYYAAILFSLSLLKMGGFIISRDRKNFVPQAREYLFGGMLLLREREGLIRAISKLTGKGLKLEPDYYSDLLELVNRLVKFSSRSKDIPRYLEIVLYEYVLNKSKLKLEDIFKSQYSIDTLKLVKDIVLFLCDVAEIDKKAFEELLEL